MSEIGDSWHSLKKETLPKLYWQTPMQQLLKFTGECQPFPTHTHARTYAYTYICICAHIQSHLHDFLTSQRPFKIAKKIFLIFRKSVVDFSNRIASPYLIHPKSSYMWFPSSLWLGCRHPWLVPKSCRLPLLHGESGWPLLPIFNANGATSVSIALRPPWRLAQKEGNGASDLCGLTAVGAIQSQHWLEGWGRRT